MSLELLKILLSGVLGGIIAAITTHTLNHHRERVRLLTEKLELVLQCLDQFRERSLARQLLLEGDVKDVSLNTQLFYQISGWDLTTKLQALVALHFPSLRSGLNEIVEKNAHFVTAISSMRSGCVTKDMICTIGEIFNGAEEMEKDILLRSDALCGKWMPRLAAWWDRKCNGQEQP
ncbi:hypothetical protein OKA04_04615 [Luteolibacter flavescens]|uniref:Uncharacterized protein n=1 Tax=Luteolibacter flavescens TaxID=1859460 RepID=A0ABT3FLD8_9BACT|nr:hypothetical protein [Luteolibacter flavescens]MCW1883999.1 hypothetical protein [Luteolibacter flavescens]